jgi:hypothetical protein
MRIIFFSYSSLLHDLNSGKFTQQDLDNGLYYFGCKRSLLFDIDPAEREYAAKKFPEQVPIVKAAVEKAERGGRVAWRPEHEGCSEQYSRDMFATLSQLLQANGYRAIQQPKTRHRGCRPGWPNWFAIAMDIAGINLVLQREVRLYVDQYPHNHWPGANGWEWGRMYRKYRHIALNAGSAAKRRTATNRAKKYQRLLAGVEFA